MRSVGRASFLYSKKHVFNHRKILISQKPVKREKKWYIEGKGVFMNIHKHLRSLFLISTALFWANCSNDTDISSPKNDTEGLSNSLSDIESSSSKESGQEQASSAEESSTSEGKRTEQDSTAAKSSSSQGKKTESSSSLDMQKVYKGINPIIGSAIGEIIPDSCEPNRFGWDPKNEALISFFSKSSTQFRIEKMLSPDSGSAASISEESKECLKSMLDTLSQAAYLYGSDPQVALDAKCSDGSIYYSKEVTEYAKREGISEEEAIKEYEKYDDMYRKKTMILDQEVDNCLAPSERPTRIMCYSDTVQNTSGKTFDIIECSDGKKYLSHPVEDTNENSLPEGVQKEFITPPNSYLANCNGSTYVCKFSFDGRVHECNGIIKCPSSDQAESSSSEQAKSSSSKQAKSSSSSKEPEEKSSSSVKNEATSSSATYGGEFAKKSIL